MSVRLDPSGLPGRAGTRISLKPQRRKPASTAQEASETTQTHNQPEVRKQTSLRHIIQDGRENEVLGLRARNLTQLSAAKAAAASPGLCCLLPPELPSATEARPVSLRIPGPRGAAGWGDYFLPCVHFHTLILHPNFFWGEKKNQCH